MRVPASRRLPLRLASPLALGVFAAFGAISIGTWLYFRTRSPDSDEFHPEPATE